LTGEILFVLSFCIEYEGLDYYCCNIIKDNKLDSSAHRNKKYIKKNLVGFSERIMLLGGLMRQKH